MGKKLLELWKSEWVVQFIRFGLVGLSNTAVNYLIYTLSLLGMQRFSLLSKWDYLAAQGIAFLLSVLWSFYWNNRLVFAAGGGRRNLWRALLRTYVSYSATGLFLNGALLTLWVSGLHLSEFIAPLLCLPVTVPLNFVLNKFWAFGEEKKAGSGKGMYLLYTGVFALFTVIDWTQVVLAGAYWAITVNCIGFLMTFLILSQFSWKGISPRPYLIWLSVWIPGALGAALLWYRNPGRIYPWQFLTGALNVLCLGVTAIRLLQERREGRLCVSRRGAAPALCWALMTLLMCFSPLGSLWQVWYLALFGAFYLTQPGRERKRELREGALSGVILGFLILQAFAYGFRPYDEVRYKGLFYNCNNNALMYLTAYAAVLTEIFLWTGRKRGRRRTVFLGVYYVLAGGLLGFLFMTLTRTALLVAAFVTAVFLAVLFRKERREGTGPGPGAGRGALRAALLGMLAVLLFPGVFLSVRYLPAILHHPVWWGSEYDPSRVHSFDPWNSEKYVSFQEFWQTAAGRIAGGGEEGSGRAGETEDAPGARENAEGVPAEGAKGLSGQEASSEEGLPGQEASSEEGLPGQEPLIRGDGPVSSLQVRKAIYRVYLEHLNLRGHRLEEGFFQITEDYHAYHAQNVWIQMAFYYGIPAGLLFLVLTVLLGVRSIGGVWREPDNGWYLFRLLVFLVFFGYGALEITWNTGQVTLLLLYFVQKDLSPAGKAGAGKR